MLTFLMICSIAFLIMQTLSLKNIKTISLRENILVNSAFSGVIGIVLILYAFFEPMTFSGATIWLGMLFGILFIATVSFYYYAMQTGPLSYTTFFFSSSMMIPAVVGIFIFKEKPKLSTVIGVLIFLVAFYFISVLGVGKGKKGNTKWFLLCFATWFLNGSLAVVSKTQQTLLDGQEVFSFMLVAFCSAFIFALLFYFILLFKNKPNSIIAKEKSLFVFDMKVVKQCAIPLIGAAIGTGGGNIILTYLNSRIPSAYLFPLVQGCIMVGITTYSLFFLKEKINKYGLIGILLGILAIIIMNV